MTLDINKKKEIEEVIINCVRNKFLKYKPESTNMPFHYRLIGKDRMALYSFIQSLNTTFGISIFEPVAISLAKDRFKKVEKQYSIGNSISEKCQSKIQEIINNISIAIVEPNKNKEIELIKSSISKDKINKMKPVKVDLYIETFNNEIFLFDLKTAKPNISEFKTFKRTLLEWVGIILTNSNSNLDINTVIAIPYNPYEPEPYQRWTIKGILDIKNELMVGKDFWDFLGGNGAYEDLLYCFENAGIKLRNEIDEYFSKFK